MTRSPPGRRADRADALARPRRGMQKLTHYDDVVKDIIDELGARSRERCAAGVRPEQIIIDPGLGFSKTGSRTGRCWPISTRSPHSATRCSSRPAASGSSASCSQTKPASCGHRPARGRHGRDLDARRARGRWCVRVHEPAATADAVRVVARLARGGVEAMSDVLDVHRRSTTPSRPATST